MAQASTLTIVLADQGEITDQALDRVARLATRVVVPGRKSALGKRLESRDVEVVVDDGNDGVRGAMARAATHGATLVATGTTRSASRLVRDAAQGAAEAVDNGAPAVALMVLAEGEVGAGPVLAVSRTGELSGYEPLLAAGFAAASSSDVELIWPASYVHDPRSDVEVPAVEMARRAGIQWSEQTDPAPVVRAIERSADASAVVMGILDVPDATSLLSRKKLSRRSVAEGSPAAAVQLVKEAKSDVVLVFDGTRLIEDHGRAARAFAVFGAGMAGIGAFAAMGGVAHAAPAQPRVPNPTTGRTQDQVSVTVTGKSTVSVTNPGKAPIDVTVDLIGQRGHAGTTYHIGTRTLPTVPGGAVDHVVNLPEFQHDMGHNLLRAVLHLHGPNVDVTVPITISPTGVVEFGTAVTGTHPTIPADQRAPEFQPTEPVEPPRPTPQKPPKLHEPPLAQTPQKPPTLGNDQTPPLVPGNPTPTPQKPPKLNEPPLEQTPQEPPTLGNDQTPPLVPGVPTPLPTPHQVPDATPHPHGGETPHLVPGEPTPLPTPHQVPDATPHPHGGETPHLVPGEPTPLPTPQQVPDATPEATPVATPNLTGTTDQVVPPGTTGQTTPGTTGQTTPGTTGQTTPGTTGQTTPGTTGQTTPGTTGQTTPGTTGQTTPGTTGQTTPGTTGQTTPGTTGQTTPGTTTSTTVHHAAGGPGSHAPATGGAHVPTLPNTGVDGSTELLAAVSAAMLAAGGGLVVAARRAESASEDALETDG